MVGISWNPLRQDSGPARHSPAPKLNLSWPEVLGDNEQNVFDGDV